MNRLSDLCICKIKSCFSLSAEKLELQLVAKQWRRLMHQPKIRSWSCFQQRGSSRIFSNQRRFAETGVKSLLPPAVLIHKYEAMREYFREMLVRRLIYLGAYVQVVDTIHEFFLFGHEPVWQRLKKLWYTSDLSHAHRLLSNRLSKWIAKVKPLHVNVKNEEVEEFEADIRHVSTLQQMTVNFSLDSNLKNSDKISFSLVC